MDFKTGLFLIALAIGCSALPTQPEHDMSMYFEHVDQNARIVGGLQAQEGSHPHMAALTVGLLVRSFLCGGSLVSSEWVLTAAHCIDAAFSFGSLNSQLRVTVGTNRWNTGGQTYTVASNATHPHYVASTIKNDIGLLRLSTTAQLSATVSPITLSYNMIGGDVETRVAGWGRIRSGGSLSATLLELTLSTIEGERCVADVLRASTELNVRAPPVEPHIEICTYHSPGQGTCNGDSGSALVRTDTDEQVGVVSWGFPCARGAPDMFARVSAFQDFIQQHV